jgi:putative endonuclease
MDSIRVSEAPDPGSIPGEATSSCRYYAYVLKSLNQEYYYKGHCKNLSIRLQQHNSGKTISLRPYISMVIIYSEEFKTEAEAIKREKYFKSAAGRRYLKKKLGLE